jgi:DNA-binding response OmpR family regulator
VGDKVRGDGREEEASSYAKNDPRVIGTQPSTVMVVEDDEPTTAMVTAELEEHGYRVLTAKSGHEAFRILERARPSVIVLDLLLPDVNGRELVQWCHDKPTTTSIPIIVTSALYGVPEDADIQSLVFVEKPYDLDVLLVLIDDAVSLDSL